MSPRRRPALVVVAPAAFRASLRRGLRGCGIDVRFAPRPRARRGPDRYGLVALAAREAGRCDGVLVVAPRKVPAARACPAAVSSGLPLASVHADRPADLARWLASLPRAGAGGAWAVVAPGQHHYLQVARDLRRRLARGGRPVATWHPHRVTLEALRARLAEGPALVAYSGQGAPEGLLAFGGVTDRDLRADAGDPRACGALALFSCRTLGWRGARPGFAWRMVASGRAAVALAAVDDVERAGNTAFARRCADRLAAAPSPGAAMTALVRDLDARSPLRAIVRSYRLVGLPVAPAIA